MFRECQQNAYNIYRKKLSRYTKNGEDGMSCLKVDECWDNRSILNKKVTLDDGRIQCTKLHGFIFSGKKFNATLRGKLLEK